MTFESCLVVFVCVCAVIHKQKWRKSEAVVVTFFIHWISAKLKKNKNKDDERVRESERERERERATREREKPK